MTTTEEHENETEPLTPRYARLTSKGAAYAAALSLAECFNKMGAHGVRLHVDGANECPFTAEKDGFTTGIRWSDDEQRWTVPPLGDEDEVTESAEAPE